jgi:hypothetical protein
MTDSVLPSSEHPAPGSSALPIRDDSPRFVIFFIPLPVPLGLPTGSTYRLEREEIVGWLKGVEQYPTPETSPIPPEFVGDGHNLVSLKIWQVPYKFVPAVAQIDCAMQVAKAVLADTTDSPASVAAAENFADTAPEEFTTVVEAVTPFIRDKDQNDDAAITLAFDRCLEEVNFLQRAYLLTTHRLKVRTVSRQVLPPVVPMGMRNLLTGQWSGPAPFWVNVGLNLPFGTTALEQSQYEQLIAIMGRLRAKDPFAQSSDWSHHARQFHDLDGNYALAVVASYTASELLLDGLLLLMAWEEGLQRKDSKEWFDFGLPTRIRRYYASRLGGVWDITKGEFPIGQWYSQLGRVRHRVVHTGYRPSEQDSRQGLDAFGVLEDFLKRRAAAKRLLYPRTALLFLGQPGLTRLGLYNGKIRRFAEEQALVEPGWLASYRQWLESA